MKPVGVGIIGAAGSFGQFITAALQEMNTVKITTIAGRDPQKTERFAHKLGVNYYLDYRGLIADPAVQLVIIATPPHLHAQMGIDAAIAKKHVFVEKPLAIDLDDADRLLRVAEENGIQVGIDYVMRYNHLFDLVKEIIDKKILGRFQRLDFQNFAADEHLPLDRWFWDRSKSGGIFVEHGVHFFDIYGWLIGSEPVDILSLKAVREGTNQEDRLVTNIKYANDVLATYYHAFDKPERIERTTALLDFDRGYLTINGLIATEFIVEGIMDEDQLSFLNQLTGSRIKTLADYYGSQLVTSGGGNLYEVCKHISLTWTNPLPRQVIYKESIKKGLQDLIDGIHHPEHKRKVTARESRNSLALALAARDLTTVSYEEATRERLIPKYIKTKRRK